MQIQIVCLPSDTQIILASSQIVNVLFYANFVHLLLLVQDVESIIVIVGGCERLTRDGFAYKTETKHCVCVCVSSTHGVDMRAFTWCTKYNNNEYVVRSELVSWIQSGKHSNNCRFSIR